MNNIYQYGLERLLVESFTLGVKAGVPAETLFECIRNGAGGRGHILNELLPKTYLRGKFDNVGSTFWIAKKDVALALELGREYDVPMQQASDTYNELTAGANRKEWANLDRMVCHLLQEERAGNIEVRLPMED